MKHCLTLNLKSDSKLITEYEIWHSPENIPKEIIEGIYSIGIKEMEIFRWENRLFMIIETENDFDWDTQMKRLSEIPGQKEWEIQMDLYQERISNKEKWVKMQNIFKLTNCK